MALRAARRIAFEPYMRAMDRAPLATKCATAGILMAAGDTIAQTQIEKRRLSEMDMVLVVSPLSSSPFSLLLTPVSKPDPTRSDDHHRPDLHGPDALRVVRFAREDRQDTERQRGGAREDRAGPGSARLPFAAVSYLS
jgi:hypothetical protein